MRIRAKLLAMVAVAAVGLASATLPASADMVVYTGEIGPNDTPTMPVVTISNPDCVDQGVFQVAYREHLLPANLSGPFTFTHTESDGANLSMYLMTADWYPGAAYPYCIAAVNGSSGTITANLDPSVRYSLVVFDDSFDQNGGSYEVSVNRPGLNPPVLRPGLPGDRPSDSVPATTTTAPVTTTTRPSTTSTTAPATTTTRPSTTTSTTAPVTTTTRPGTVPQAGGARPVPASASYTG
ncbi:MAG: hypothetical protein WBB52_15420 [Acidimicrobiales bacterium]|jgi:hypothetical protein